MLDIGIWELVVLAIVSLIVVGPKDFPVFLRTVGRTISKIKGIAREFQNTMEDVATDIDLEKVRKENQHVHATEKTTDNTKGQPVKVTPSSIDNYMEKTSTVAGGYTIETEVREISDDKKDRS